MFRKDTPVNQNELHAAIRYEVHDLHVQSIRVELELALTFVTLARTYFSLDKDVQGKASLENAVRAHGSACTNFGSLVDPDLPDVNGITALFAAVQGAISGLQLL